MLEWATRFELATKSFESMPIDPGRFRLSAPREHTAVRDCPEAYVSRHHGHPMDTRHSLGAGRVAGSRPVER